MEVLRCKFVFEIYIMKDNELTQMNAKVLTQKHPIIAKDTAVKKNLVNILYITNNHYIF